MTNPASNDDGAIKRLFVGKIITPARGPGHTATPTALAESDAADPEDIPFIPAFDLLESADALPSHQEVAAIAVSLHRLHHRTPSGRTAWELAARLDSVAGRF